eukprot:TRINITY_DN13937_c0_g1_i1.p1 TRINITY_DN13937_c0_g1~~TRINITY_DN13937_c0_g1_i1.p1  ORF type:complete len:178 (-),score=15.55 TRINITY_DN13937_c0_g1_i1:283-786(-)
MQPLAPNAAATPTVNAALAGVMAANAYKHQYAQPGVPLEPLPTGNYPTPLAHTSVPISHGPGYSYPSNVVYEPPAYATALPLRGGGGAPLDSILLRPFAVCFASGQPAAAIALFVAGFFCCPIWLLGFIFMKADNRITQTFGMLSMLMACLACVGAAFALTAMAMGY